eukprot:m51a1_g3395 hypothetical protein (398) ;mRNA; r:524817-526256
MGVAGAVVAMLGLGAQHSWGTITMFVSDPGLLRGTPSTATIWAYALCGVVVPFMMFAAPPLQRRIGIAPTGILGSVVAGLGLMAASQARSLPMLVATFGVVYAAGVGIAYVTCVVSAQKWFPSRRGLVGGLVLAAYGCSAFMFNNVEKMAANPRGLPSRAPDGSTDEQAQQWADEFHKEMMKRVPVMFVSIGAITFALGLLGSMFVHQPEEKPLEPLPVSEPEPELELVDIVEENPEAGGDPVPVQESVHVEDLGPRAMMGTLQFWMLVYVIVLTVLSAVMFLYFETRTSVVLWSLCTCIIWLCYGGVLSLLPTAVADAFGTRWHDINYSWLFSGLAIGSLMQALMLTMLLERLGSYRKLFYIMGTLSTVACFLMVAYKPPGRGRWFAVWLSYKRAK